MSSSDSTETVDLLKFYEEHVARGQKYCQVCLRTEKETRLVNPFHLAELSHMVNLQVNESDDSLEKSACYICENAAAAAIRLLVAWNTAYNINNIFKQLEKQQKEIVCKKKHEQLIVLTKIIQSYRDQTTLKTTEALVVDNCGVQWKIEDKPKEEIENNGPPPKLPKLHESLQVSEPCHLETVVINDEAGPAKPINEFVPTLVSLNSIFEHQDGFVAAVVPSQMQMYVKNGKKSQDLCLHPMVQGKDGKTLIPTLSCELKNGQMELVENIYQYIPHVTVNKQFIVPKEYVIPQISKNTKGKKITEGEKVDSILKNILQDKLANFDKKRSLRTQEFEKERNQYVIDLETISKMLEDEKNNDELSLPVISEVVSEAKQESGKEKIVDWEDKIPMDVISFVGDPDMLRRVTDSDPDVPLIPDNLPSSNQQQNTECIPIIDLSLFFPR